MNPKSTRTSKDTLDKTTKQAWRSVRRQLQELLPNRLFDTWIKQARPLSYKNGVLIIGVLNEFEREKLEVYNAAIGRLMTDAMGETVSVKVVVSDDIKPRGRIIEIIAGK